MKVLISAMLLAASGTLAAAQSRPMVAVGDGKDLWLIVAAKSKEPQSGDQQQMRSIVVLHRQLSDPADQLQRAVRLRGRVVPGGAAASEQRLWLVYENMSVQSMGLAGTSRRVLSPYSKPRTERQLVLGTQLRSLGANRRGPWALVKVEKVEALKLIDQPPADGGDDDDDDDDDDQGPSEKKTTDASENSTPEPIDPLSQMRRGVTPSDRLLQLDRGQWRKINLPANWPADSRGWMVFNHSTSLRPRLISEISQGLFAVYQYRDDQWHQQDYQLDVPVQADIKPLSIEGQLVMAVLQNPRGERPNDLSVALSVLRDGHVIKLGVLMIKDAPSPVWAVAPAGKSAALLVMDKPVDGRLSAALWTTMDLRGQGDETPQPLQIKTYSPYSNNSGHVLVVAALSVSMLLMITFTRKKPLETPAKLPATLEIADLPRRVMAGLIDLAPCVLLTMFLFDGMRDHPDRLWPGASDTWKDMLPGLAMIGINITHTMITELFTGRTLGKMMLGLKVVTIDGEAPNIWQVISRNLLRSLDLIAWYALPILMVLSPNRQRLGDVIAGTVVVARREEEESDQ